VQLARIHHPTFGAAVDVGALENLPAAVAWAGSYFLSLPTKLAYDLMFDASALWTFARPISIGDEIRAAGAKAFD